MNGLLKKIKDCKTMPELDGMRLELVTIGRADQEIFKKLQDAFIAKKNQLNRIPRMDRTW